MTYVGAIGDLDRPDPGPRGRTDPVLTLIVYAGRYDDREALAGDLDRIAGETGSDISSVVIATGLPPVRDAEGCVAGVPPTARTVVFIDVSDAIAERDVATIRRILSEEWSRLGPDGRLDVHVIDATPAVQHPVYRACRHEDTAEHRHDFPRSKLDV